MSYVLNFNLLWVLNRCMMPTNEVGTRLGAFDMT
jgi:hypothetical protein